MRKYEKIVCNKLVYTDTDEGGQNKRRAQALADTLTRTGTEDQRRSVGYTAATDSAGGLDALIVHIKDNSFNDQQGVKTYQLQNTHPVTIKWRATLLRPRAIR